MPVTAPAGTNPNPPAAEQSAATQAATQAAATAGSTTASEIGAAIETLAGLRDKGHLTADEFTAKKTELLGRL
ncbi:MAG: SHOCT domain-containing protein [Nakamurella sp.]